jgi:hypothetical protein
VVAGLVRQNQFELALDHIAQMRMKNIPVQNWLHGLMIYNLCEIEDFDEVLRQMDSRLRQGYDIPLDLWHYVLDAASEAPHRKLARYVWTRMVELGYLRPAYGTCRNVLTAAGREGDVLIAASVFRYLEDIGIPRGLEDYEAMAEAHLMSGNLYSALEVLCTMHKCGIALERSSTRSVLTFMIMTRAAPRDGWNILKQLKLVGYDIPIDCANVVIEFCGSKALYDPSTVDEAITFYKEFYSLCPSGASASTYNSLISMCRRAFRREAAMFIIKEMSALNVMPRDETFEDIILMCLERNSFGSAYHYSQDFMERGGRLSKDAAVQIRDKCSASPDRFAIELQDHPLVRRELKYSDGDEGNQERKQVSTRMRRSSWLMANPRRPRKKRQDPAARRARHNIRQTRRRMEVSRETRTTMNKERRRRKRWVEAFKRLTGTKKWADCKTGGRIPEDQMKPSNDPTDSGESTSRDSAGSIDSGEKAS